MVLDPPGWPGQTLAELAHRGVTLAPSTVEGTVEKYINTVAERLGIQVRSAWRYFDAAVLADRLAGSANAFEESSNDKGVGQAPMPPIDNPELALVLAGVPAPWRRPAATCTRSSSTWRSTHGWPATSTARTAVAGVTAAAARPDTTGRRGCAPSPRCSRTSASGSTAMYGPAQSTTRVTPSLAADVSAQERARRSERSDAGRTGWPGASSGRRCAAASPRNGSLRSGRGR
jgi:hypothetical protein